MTETELGTQREGPESFVQGNKVSAVHQLAAPHKTFTPRLERPQVSPSGLRHWRRPIFQMRNRARPLPCGFCVGAVGCSWIPIQGAGRQMAAAITNQVKPEARSGSQACLSVPFENGDAGSVVMTAGPQ